MPVLAASGYPLDHPFLLLAVFTALVCFAYRIYLASLVPRDVSLIWEKPGHKHFSLWTRLSFYFDCSSLYRDVWEKFSKLGLPVMVPTLGTRKEIFLPHSAMKWVLSQPASVMGMWEAFNEMFQLGHSLGDDKYMIDTWPHLLARHVLTQELEDYIMPVHDELQRAIDENLGVDDENWTAVDLLQTMRMIVNQTGSRFVVGETLCRDQEYLTTIMQTIDGVVANAGFTGFMPEALRPIIGSLVCWSTRAKLSRLEARFEATLQERIVLMDLYPDDETHDPHDLMQRMLRYAREHRPEELATDQMTRRLLMANLGFIYQASFAMSNLLINVLDSDAAYDTVATLRREATQFLHESSGDPTRLWTRQNVARMVHADSAARETLRLYTVPTRAVVRKVMVDGVRTGDGVDLPRGSMVSFVSQPMHTDAERFTDPNTFDPFRFVRLRQEERLAEKKPAGDAGGNWSRHAFLSTADLLIFGRGRNSCPGRFLVDFQLKMFISHLVTNYDLQLPDEFHKSRRRTNQWLLEFIFPPKGVKIMVRRRKKGST